MSSEMRRLWTAVLAKAKSRWVRLGLAAALLVFTGADSARWEQCALQPTEIFSGVTYGCDRLERTGEGRGVLHWVRVDLRAPGIELYVTPLDLSAVERGWEYRLRWIDEVARDEGLAVAVNGTLFTARYAWLPRLPGDLANGVETVVSDHVTSHFWEHTYLLWFDDDLTPHLRPSKPPLPAELRQAKWGIGGQGVGLHDGRVWSGSGRQPDSRTAVGIDAERRLLFLAVAEWASPHLMLEELAKLGARDAMLLDGGASSAIAIGEGARDVATGPLFGGSRPVATFFGVRARRLSAPQGG
jgi:Phosphodiester glycosidase